MDIGLLFSGMVLKKTLPDSLILFTLIHYSLCINTKKIFKMIVLLITSAVRVSNSINNICTNTKYLHNFVFFQIFICLDQSNYNWVNFFDLTRTIELFLADKVISASTNIIK